MKIYLINIFLTLLIGGVAVIIKNDSTPKEQYESRKVSYLAVIMILVLWTAIYALRDNVGSDFSGYKYFYERIGILNQTLRELLADQRDFMFAILEYGCFKMFNGSWLAFSTVLGVITYLPILLTLRKKSVNFVISIAIYIFTLCFYAGFNGVRQAIAVSLTFYAYYIFFQNKKYIRYIIVMVLAFGFHASVIFVIPFHLLTLKKLKSLTFKFVVVAMVFCYTYIWDLWVYMINLLEFIGQNKMAEDYVNVVADGASYLRFMVYLVPVIPALMFYRTISKKYHDVDCEIMFMIIAVIFMLFSTKYWLFARIASYFSISSVFFIPKLECIFDKNSRMIGMSVVLILYFLFMCALLLHGEGGYYPYKMIPL